MTLNGYPPALKHETVWLDAHRYHDAEKQYYESQAKGNLLGRVSDSLRTKHLNILEGRKSTIAIEIANAREKIKKFLAADSDPNSCQIFEKIQRMEEENKLVNKRLAEMSTKIKELEKILCGIQTTMKDTNSKPEKLSNQNSAPAADDDDDIDLFGSDEETEEEARIKEERVKAYANKKAKKPALVAKSSVVLDVKPWDDEIDLKELETAVRKIEVDGLKWGASKLEPVAFGIKKLVIIAIVEDEKVSIDWLQETIQEIEDLVQSVDIAAFNKL